MTTKPIITYKSSKLPVIDSFNISIAQKKISKTECVNWADKTELTNYIDSLYIHPTSDTYLYIICQCNEEFIYISKNDVPSTDVVCACGRKVIEYS